jgi:hypothetical protein
MSRIPSITPASIFASLSWRKGRRRTLQRHVARAHDRLPHVFETMVYMPWHFDWVDMG